VNVNAATGCFITGDSDSIIKIWSPNKHLLQEFKFHEAVEAAMFTSADHGILLSHGQTVSYISPKVLPVFGI
jgi:hypothetical protein